MQTETNSKTVENENENWLIIKRPVYTRAKFENEFAVKEVIRKKSATKKVKSFAKTYLNPLGLFTIVNLLAEYNFKLYLVPDILSGLTGILARNMT